MVKCLNAGLRGAAVVKWGIADQTSVPPTSRCPKYLTADYERIDELDPRTRQRVTEFVCPECGTGPRPLNAREVAVFLKDEKVLREARELALVNRQLSVLPTTLSTKERAKEEEKIRFRAKRQLFGEEEAQKWLKKGTEEKALLKSLTIPTTSFGKYIKKILPSIYFSVGGLLAAGLLGSPWIFFAALAFGISSTMPSPESIKSVHDEAQRIKTSYETRIKNARSAKASPEMIRNLIEEMKAEIELETLLEKVNEKTKGQIKGLIIVKDSLKLLGFLILTVSLLLNSVIPFAGLAGLIIGFIAYFSISPERKSDKEE